MLAFSNRQSFKPSLKRRTSWCASFRQLEHPPPITMEKMMLLALCVSAAIIGGDALHTVRQLDATAYVGRWYQVYTNSWADIFSNLVEPTCVTADYGLVNGTYVTVYNANWQFDENARDDIGGYAYIPDVAEPGKLKVVLDGVPFEGDYWIFKLGPMIEGQYQYSLITDGEAARQLFVLARDPEEFYELYDREVSEYLPLHGFTGPLKEPYATVHNEDCVYPPLA